MAAATKPRAPQLVDLRRVSAAALEPLLDDEILEWRRKLDWDFRSSAGLVRRFVSVQALTGYALLDEGLVAGYSYFVREESKGLIGDLYLRAAYRTPDNESRLLDAVAGDLMHTPHLTRIESQLILLEPSAGRCLPCQRFASIHPRNFMAIDSGRASALRPGPAARHLHVEQWRDNWQELASQLIAEAYDGHIDGEINDQYRSAAGAWRFLTNIVQYPGCGQFFEPASFLAFDRPSGRLCAMSLASLLADDIGHITQLCVGPQFQGTGVGYELLRRSLAALVKTGCRRTSLTVTAANNTAVRLYERAGFETIRVFAAMVWDGFTATAPVP